MSHTHVGVFERNTGGESWPVWVDRKIRGGSRSGSGYIDGVRADGSKVLLKVRDAVLILKDLQDFHGSATGFTAGHVGYVTHVEDAWECLGCEKSHAHMTKKDGVVPLYFANSQKDIWGVQQAARWNISKGANNAAMKDSYVGGMYVRSMQNLVYAISNEISRKSLAKKFDALLYLARAARDYADKHSETAKVFDAAARDTNLQDTLERVVAMTLSHQLSEEALLRCLEVSLKRGFRRENWKETKLVDNPALVCGLVSVMLIAPMLRGFLEDSLDVADVMIEYEEKTKGLLEVLLKKKCSPVDLLHYLMVNVAGLSAARVTKARVGEFYSFCRTSKNYKVNADFAQYGFVERQVKPFAFRTSSEAVWKRLTPTTTHIECAGGWAAVELSELGEYRLSNFKTIGVATQGWGNTLGQKFAANFRVSANRDLAFLPKYKEGKSSAGKHYRRNYYGRWNYDSSTPLDMSSPVTIIVKKSGFTVRQKGKVWFGYATTDPVVLGLKKYEFQLEKLPYTDVAKKTTKSVSYAAATGGGGKPEPKVDEVNEDDVCAMALARYVAKTKGKKGN